MRTEQAAGTCLICAIIGILICVSFWTGMWWLAGRILEWF